MARKKERADWPKFMYEDGDGYLYYKHPAMRGKRQPLPQDLAIAKRIAAAVNEHFDSEEAEQFLNTIIEKTRDSMLLREIMPEFYIWSCANIERDKSKNTVRTYCKQIAEADFSSLPADQITVLHLAEFLDSKTINMYIKLRARLIKLFEYCLAKGFRSIQLSNPASATLRKSKPETIRKRISIDAFNQIAEVAKDEFPPLYFTMLIMLCTTLRPIDVVNLLITNFTPATNNNPAILKTVIRKSIKKDKPQNIKWLDIELSTSEDAIIRKAIQTAGVLSPLIVRHMKRYGGKVGKDSIHWSQLSVESVSNRFTEIRNRLGLYSNLLDKQRPTLYECRALGGKQHERSGRPKKDVQALMAHTDESTTDIYLAGHEVKVTKVVAGMNMERYL